MSEYYDNLGLFKDLSKCEENLLEMINYNFFKLDSTWQLRVIDIVDDLPLDPIVGDVYISPCGFYNDDYCFQLFDGNDWNEIKVRYGNLFFLESVDDFYYFDGYEFVAFSERYGNVFNFSYADDYSVAVFYGGEGKVIQGSSVKVLPEGILLVPDSIYTENIYSDNIFSYHLDSTNIYSDFARIGNIESIYADIKTIDSDLISVGNLSGEMVAVELYDDTKIIIKSLFSFFDVDIASKELNTITLAPTFDGDSPYLFAIENKSGDTVTLNSLGNISLGEESILEIQNGSTAIILYSPETDKFSVVSGGGGGGGGSNQVIWETQLDAPIKRVERGIELFGFPNESNYKIYSAISVPKNYFTGDRITLEDVKFIQRGDGQYIFNAKTTLIKREGLFTGPKTPYSYDMVTNPDLFDGQMVSPILFLNSADGTIDGQDIDPHDLLIVELGRVKLDSGDFNSESVDIIKNTSSINPRYQ